MKLQGKTALITGGAHRIGKAIAIAFAKHGTNIVLHYGRSTEAAQKTQKELETYNVKVNLVQADLVSQEDMDKIVELIKNQIGQIDILINSAATFKKQKLQEITWQDWDKSLNINLKTPFYLSQQLAPLMLNNNRKEENGCIINISDLSGVFAWKDFIQHGISKSGLIHLTKVLARELAPTIRVNAITPGPILPPLSMDKDDPLWIKLKNGVPLQSSGSPKLVGETLVFIAKNRFLTGSIIPLDGGESLVGSAIH